MDFHELEQNLNKLMKLDSVQNDQEALDLIQVIKQNTGTEKRFFLESESSQVSLTLTHSGQIHKASGSAIKSFQLESCSLSNINFYDLIHPDYIQEIRFATTNASPILRECPIKVGDQYKWYQLLISFNIEDQMFRLLVTDINDLKTLESDYQHQSDFIAKIIEHIPVGVFCREPNGQFILWSQKCEEMFGYNSTHVLKRHPDDVFPEELSSQISNLESELLASGQSVENTIQLKNGDETKIIRILKTPFLEKNEPIMVIGICEDITMKTELARNNELLLLEKQEEKVRREVESLISRSDLILYTLSLTPTPHISYISPNVVDITGYTQQDFKNDVYLLLSSIESETDTYLKNIVQDSCPIRIGKEYPFKAADGNTIWLRNDATLEVKDGIRQLIGTCINISETKEMEAEKNTAIDATRVKSEFLAHMSHEIRTPINGVLGLNSLLLKTSLNEEQQYYVELIHKSASSLLEIINDILDISKIESGKLDLEVREFNLHKFLNETLEVMEVQARQKGLKFDIQIGSLPVRVKGDSKHLGQIIRNLVNNAIKFTKEGAISIKAEQLESDFMTSVLKFEIQDSGIGIPKDRLDLIFNSYEQAADSISRQYGGSGLGLNICKKLIELMNGEISVHSNDNGTIFTFTVNVGTSQQQTTTQIDLPINIAEINNLTKPSDDKPIEVLIVEDNDINQLVLSGLLKKFGNNKITCASNGEIGFAKFQESHFDIVFMDCQMPIMDGFAATRCIRASEPHKRDTPVIAITANAMTTAREECLSAGMDEYITKPIQEKSLKEVYERFTKNRNSEPAPEVPEVKASVPLFDFTNLKALEDTDLVAHVVTAYCSGIQNEVIQLIQNLKECDMDATKFVLHSIQGLSGNIGAIQVAEKAKTLSTHIKDFGFNNYVSELQALEKATHTSKNIVQDYLENNN